MQVMGGSIHTDMDIINMDMHIMVTCQKVKQQGSTHPVIVVLLVRTLAIMIDIGKMPLRWKLSSVNGAFLSVQKTQERSSNNRLRAVC